MRPTSARRSSAVQAMLSRSSETPVTTVPRGSARNTCSAKLSVAPGNQRASGTARVVSTAVGWPVNRTSQKSARSA